MKRGKIKTWILIMILIGSMIIQPNNLTHVYAASPSASIALKSAISVTANTQQVVDGTLTLNNISSNVTGATVRITDGFSSGEDKLSVNTSGSLVANYDSNTGKLTITGTATSSEYQSVLRTVKFYSTSTSATRSIVFSVDMFGNGVQYRIENEHYYEYISAPGITWQDAEKAAESRTIDGEKGYLATITSESENNFVYTKCKGDGWLGASDYGHSKEWYWVTGPEGVKNGGKGTKFCTQKNTSGGVLSTEPGMYQKFQSGEPNDYGAGEDYLHMYAANGYWNDFAYNNYGIAGFLVEYGSTTMEDYGSSPAITITASTIITIMHDQAAPLGLTGIAPTFYGDSNGKITGANDSMEYRLASAAIYTAVPSSTTEITGLAEGTYYVRYKAKTGYSAGTDTTVTIVDGAKKNQNAPTGLSGSAPTYYGDSNGRIIGVNNSMEYRSKDAVTYTSVPYYATQITGLTSGTYYVRYKAKTGYNEGTDATVTIGEGANRSQSVPFGLAGTAPTLYGDNDGKITGVNDTMEYRSASDVTYTEVPSSATVITGLTTGTYYVRYKAKPGYNTGADAMVTVGAGANRSQSAPTGLSGTAPTINGGSDGKITGVNATMEYRSAGTVTYTEVPTSATEITGLATGTYYVRYKAKAGFNEGADATVTVGVGANKDQSAPAGLTGVAPTNYGASDGKITGGNATMEYRSAGDVTYTAVPASATEITGLTAGTYYVRYKAKTGFNAGADATVTIGVGVNKDQSAPTGLTGVAPTIYGSRDGKITGLNDTMEYRSAGDLTYTAVPASATEITGLTAGTYYVRYKAKPGYNAGVVTEIVVAGLSDLSTYNAVLASVIQSDYTEESWTSYKKVVMANLVTSDDSQTLVNTATDNIRVAQANLVYTGQDSLNVAKNSANTKLKADYTSDSWKALEDALTLPETTNAQVMAKTLAINNAIAALVKIETPIPTYSISGIVTDSSTAVSGAAISASGAAITVTNTNNSSKTYTGTTDAYGNYTITGIPDGNYIITVTKDSKNIASKNVIINGNNVSNVDIPATPVASGSNISGIIKHNAIAVSGSAITITYINDNSRNYTAFSDANGNFVIHNVLDGSYVITATMDGQTIVIGNMAVNGSNIFVGNLEITIPTPTPTPTPNPMPTPTPTPEPAKNVQEVTVDVKAGNSEDNASAIPVKRTTETDGTKTDSLTYTESKAEETIENLKKEGKDAARIVIPDAEDTVSQTSIKIPTASLDIIASGEINLQIETKNAKIEIPKETIQNVAKVSDEDLYFNLVPIKDEEEQNDIIVRAKKEVVVKTVVQDSTISVIGRPMMIETNMPSSQVYIILPLTNVEIPTDVQKREEFLSKLAVYIEHSDGEKELVRGEIVEYKDGLLGIKFLVKKFSTFTIINSDGLIQKSNACDITKVITPKKMVMKGTNLSFVVKNSTQKQKIDITVSKNASWKLYSDENCKNIITNNCMDLQISKNVEYIKVTAEDGTTKIYKITVSRKKAAVFIATNHDFADAYAGNVLAAQLDGKVIRYGYTKKEVKKTVAYILKNYTTEDTIYILGLDKAVNVDLEKILKRKGYKNIIRIGGKSKYETAMKIAEQINPKKGSKVVLINGEYEPSDANIKELCTENGYPVLYVKADSLTEYTLKALKELDPSEIYIVGDNKQISSKVIDEIQKKLGIKKKNIKRT